MSEIVFLTNSKYRDLTDDDLIAVKALEARNLKVVPRIWNETKVSELRNFRLVVVRSIWGYHQDITTFVRWLKELRQEQIRVLNSVALMQWNYSKKYLDDLTAGGVPTIPTTWIDATEKNAVAKLQLSPHKKIVIKPEVSATADFTFLLDRDDAQNYRDQLVQIQQRGAIMVQPYCEDVVTGEYSLLYFNIAGQAKYSHAVVKTPKAEDFRVQEEWGGRTLSAEPNSVQLEVAARALGAIKYSWLFARVDLISYEGCPRVAELEVIEPHLYFAKSKIGAEVFAEAVTAQL